MEVESARFHGIVNSKLLWNVFCCLLCIFYCWTTPILKTFGQFENLAIVIMSTRENIRLIARSSLAEFNLLQNPHQCTQKSVRATKLGPLGEIGANLSPQLSSREQFAKIIIKIVVKINVENIKFEFRRHWPVSNSIYQCVCKQVRLRFFV